MELEKHTLPTHGQNWPPLSISSRLYTLQQPKDLAIKSLGSYIWWPVCSRGERHTFPSMAVQGHLPFQCQTLPRLIFSAYVFFQVNPPGSNGSWIYFCVIKTCDLMGLILCICLKERYLTFQHTHTYTPLSSLIEVPEYSALRLNLKWTLALTVTPWINTMP